MATVDAKLNVTQAQLAEIGEGAVAYLREMQSDDLRGKFPGLPEIESGMLIWALFAANGQPILLTDERAQAIASAMENDLTTVAIH